MHVDVPNKKSKIELPSQQCKLNELSWFELVSLVLDCYDQFTSNGVGLCAPVIFSFGIFFHVRICLFLDGDVSVKEAGGKAMSDPSALLRPTMTRRQVKIIFRLSLLIFLGRD